jgi:hypothetical protein
VAQAARDFGVSWQAAMAAVGDHGRPRVDHLVRLGAPSAAPWLAGIRHVVIDPYQPYATAVATGLPEARLVVDHFHVIRVRHEAPCVRRRVRDPPLRAVAAAW